MEFIVRRNLVGLVSFVFRTQLSDTLPSMNGFSFEFRESKTSYKTEVENIIENCKVIVACGLRHSAFSPVIFCVMIVFNIQLGNISLKYFF